MKTIQKSGHTEYRKFGPPGTGKTTSLARDVRHAVERFGSSAVMVASYSKAAASEIASRDLPIPADRVGTLHAMGLRALGRPKVVDAKLLVDWNESYPSMRIDGDSRSVDDPLDRGNEKSRGDQLLAEYELLRSRCRPRDLWPAGVRGFAAKWEDWKRQHDAVDFGDMIEQAIEDCPVAPGNPSVGFFDECQDMSRMEWRLVRSWARAMEYVVCVGDDDQTIYEWRGADPKAFLEPQLDDEYVRVLSQSYRVPGAVHRLASRWIGGVRGRQKKTYQPRTDEAGVVVEGEARGICGRLAEPVGVAQLAARIADEGKTVAILASCSYLLSPVISEMRRIGLPFHNPWRRARGDWNPMTPPKGVSAATRLLAWLGPSIRADGTAWTIDEMQAWTEVVRVDGVLRRGAKTEIASATDMSFEDFGRWVEPEAIASGAAGDTSYLLAHVPSAKRKSLEYAAKVMGRSGTAALSAQPKIIVSTIHASKGGEADVVILCPDLSRSGYDDWIDNEAGVRRLFYVAMTRAKERLLILEPNHRRLAVDL